MSGSGSEGRKTDYFGTFLDVVASGVKHVTAAVNTNDGDLRDAVIQSLAANGGTMSIGDMLAPPFTSVGSLISVIQEPETFGLAQRDGPIVRLTADGQTVARKLGGQPAASPAV